MNFVNYEFCKLWIKERRLCFETGSNSGYVPNWKPDIVLKAVTGFNLKRTPFIILIPENSFKLGIVVLVVLNKMLVRVLIINFYSRYGLGF